MASLLLGLGVLLGVGVMDWLILQFIVRPRRLREMKRFYGDQR